LAPVGDPSGTVVSVMVVASGSHHDHGESETCKALLKLDALIHGQKHVEVSGGQSE
jgi:hypothetical protein